MKTKNWFEVSKEGLKELQEGKPKHFIARELIQNAWDENIKRCIFDCGYFSKEAIIDVEDDSPEGFRDIADAFTLFAPTYKRANPEKRGRFNLGEKQVLALCDSARIETTKGTVTFDKKGRHIGKAIRVAGSKIFVNVKMTDKEYNEMLDMVSKYLVPKGIEFVVNGKKVDYREPYKIIEVYLPTEIEDNGIFRRTQRKTKVHILKPGEKAILYEMGLPVIEIDCKFDIDVQQKVPLSIDRETVPQSFLPVLYAEVLNATYEDIEENESSQVWVREASGNKRVSQEAVREIVKKRYGDKVVVANPMDKSSIDNAISSGYKVIYGSELSKEEWGNIRSADAIKSSSEMFGSSFTNATKVEPTEEMLKVEKLAKKIAKRCLNLSIEVGFGSWEGSVGAQFGNNILSFNVGNLGKKFFNPIVSEEIIDLIVHEIAHSNGMHTEKSYHETITKLAGQLTMIALKEPKFFDN